MNRHCEQGEAISLSKRLLNFILFHCNDDNVSEFYKLLKFLSFGYLTWNLKLTSAVSPG